MRNRLYRVVLTCLVGAAAGCSNSGTALPVIGSGGGTPSITNQPVPAGAIPSVSIDDGVLVSTTGGPYTGYNVTANDVQSATEAPPYVPSPGGAAPPSQGTPPASHLITFSGNNAPDVIFRYTGVVPPLVEPNLTPGAVLPVTYGAVSLNAQFTTGATALTVSPNPDVSIELVGGTGSGQYDVRVGCTNGPSSPPPLPRYVCDLPAYGSPSGSYGTKYLDGKYSSTVGGSAIRNPILTGATGVFTPTGPTATAANPALYVVLSFTGPTNAASTGNTLGIDNVFAQQSTQ